MQKTNTKIEVTTTKDGALNFCIIGKEANLQQAKSLVLNDFQTQITLTVSVPKSIHGRLLGPKGQRIASIQEETQTKIAIPRREEESDIIKIVGLKSNAEQAVRSIQKYAREFAGKTVDKITVDRVYLLFITGPFNENLKRWEELGAKVSTSAGIFVPNHNNQQNHNNNRNNNNNESNNSSSQHYAEEVTFTIQGETNAVAQVKDEIAQIFEDKKKKCTTVNMEVKKAQHKYILGINGQNLRQFFADTGVSVELPHESESETITLRGERSKLAPALSKLYTQAHSETDDFFEVETWLHKYLIGPRKTNFIDFEAKGVEAKSLDDKIKLHGPPTEIENIKDAFELELVNLRKTIIQKNVRVEPRIRGYIIGKAGATVDQIRVESGAHVLVPKNDEASEFITLEGTAGAVAIAEEKINAIAKKYEASRKLVIDQQLHGSIIGRGGEKIRSIREKFTHVAFTFPGQGSKNDEILIVGPADEVEECYKYLDEFHKQLQESNHQVQVPIKKDIIKYIPDAQQAIKHIKNEHRVKVDIFMNTNNDNKSASPTTTATNKHQQNVAGTIKSAANESSPTTNVDGVESSTENKKKSGKKNKNKQQQQQQVNGIAPKDEAAVVSSTTDNSKSQASKASDNYAVVIGKKEDVDLAKVKLSKLFEELATTTEFEFKVSQKLRSLLGPKTRLYRQVLEEFQNKIVISFPPPAGRQEKQEKENKGNSNKRAGGDGDDTVVTNNETNGVSSTVGNNNKEKKNKDEDRVEVVKIRGPKNVAKKAEKRFEALVAECQEKVDKNYSAQVMVPTAVIEKFVYADKTKLNKIRESQSVKLSIPDKRDSQQLQCVIIGYEKNVQAALKEFNRLVKDVEERTEESIEIASQALPRLIGAQGRTVKKIMEDYKIGVKFARQGDPNPNLVVLSGRPDNILAAKNHMMKLANQYLSSAAGRANSGNSANNTMNNDSNITNNNNNSGINNATSATSNNNKNSQQQQQLIASGIAE